ncbi:MAG: methyltransferase domain-containing protein [Anaerolineales bacterium]
MKTLLRFFFRLLYHQFAFTYDLVAAVVSFNRWKDWVISVIPFIAGRRVLEVGHGPGHLQRALLSRNLIAVGIDESPQMGRLARHNLRRRELWQSQTSSSSVHSSSTHDPSSASSQSGYTQINLTRGIAQHLPFSGETFDTLVATFPAEYIFDPETLAEARRVLVPSGRFVILPGALITGRGPLDRLLAWIFRVTGEAPPNLTKVIHDRSSESLARAGFQVETHEIAVKSSLVFIVLATKSQIIEKEKHASKTP